MASYMMLHTAGSRSQFGNTCSHPLADWFGPNKQQVGVNRFSHFTYLYLILLI